jgi:hypothetical protein
MKLTRTIATLVAVSLAVCAGCASSSDNAAESNLTAGMAKRTIVKGQTHQSEVMEVFGPPDLVTHKDDMQVWTYDKISQNIETSSGYLTVLFAGVGSSSTRSQNRSTMLIIYFDSSDVVQDYRMSVTKF